MTDSKSRCVVEISTDTRPIVYLTIDRLSTDYRPTIDQLSTDHRPTIDRLSTDYRPTIDRLSTDYRPTVDRLSTDCRPLYRPLCRPISRSTLPTVNKIQNGNDAIRKPDYRILTSDAFLNQKPNKQTSHE